MTTTTAITTAATAAITTATATLDVIDNLARSRPTPDAAAVTVAAWYERKATVLRRIAALAATPLSERDIYRGWADRAHERATRLLAAVPGGAE
jgi:hypothetical protein